MSATRPWTSGSAGMSPARMRPRRSASSQRAGRILEEPAPRVVLAQEGDVGPRRDGARRDREREGAAQHGELAVDGRVPGALLLTPQDIAADVPRRDRGQTAPPEERAEVQAHVAFD